MLPTLQMWSFYYSDYRVFNFTILHLPGHEGKLLWPLFFNQLPLV